MKSVIICPGLAAVCSTLCLLCPHDTCPFSLSQVPWIRLNLHGHPMITGSQSIRGKPGGINVMMDIGFHDKEVTGDVSSSYLCRGQGNLVSEGEASEKRSKLF